MLSGGEVVRVTAIGPTVLVSVQNCVWKFQYKIIGISKLEVENRFIDYFDKNTEIYQNNNNP